MKVFVYVFEEDIFLNNMWFLFVRFFFFDLDIFIESDMFMMIGLWCFVMLNVRGLLIIIGDEFVIVMYICLVVDFFLDFYWFIK